MPKIDFLGRHITEIGAIDELFLFQRKSQQITADLCLFQVRLTKSYGAQALRPQSFV